MQDKTEPHPLAGQTVTIASGPFAGKEYLVEDWWQRVAGMTWKDGVDAGNPACVDYLNRRVVEKFPDDDDVVYGHVGGLGKLIHISQLPEPAEQVAA